MGGKGGGWVLGDGKERLEVCGDLDSMKAWKQLVSSRYSVAHRATLEYRSWFEEPDDICSNICNIHYLKCFVASVQHF